MIMNLGERIKQARRKVGMTQEGLSEASGVKQQTISKLERGASKGTVSLVPIANALNVSPEWLDTGIDAPHLDHDLIREEVSSYGAVAFKKQTKDVVKYILTTHMKDIFPKMTIDDQVETVFDLYELFDDAAVQDSAYTIKKATVLKMLNLA